MTQFQAVTGMTPSVLATTPLLLMLHSPMSLVSKQSLLLLMTS
ncbi:hypothetical protein [Synechococcus sp. WH 8109]|nr:hypothetical protein [Synechococcus sp. WH 8109]